jgi:hypothetical protein
MTVDTRQEAMDSITQAEGMAALLVRLSQHYGLPPDWQEALLHGSPAHGIKRGVINVILATGMIEAARICGSLAETTYDDAEGFVAATGCEAAIMKAASALAPTGVTKGGE